MLIYHILPALEVLLRQMTVLQGSHFSACPQVRWWHWFGGLQDIFHLGQQVSKLFTIDGKLIYHILPASTMLSSQMTLLHCPSCWASLQGSEWCQFGEWLVRFQLRKVSKLAVVVKELIYYILLAQIMLFKKMALHCPDSSASEQGITWHQFEG